MSGRFQSLRPGLGWEMAGGGGGGGCTLVVYRLRIPWKAETMVEAELISEPAQPVSKRHFPGGAEALRALFSPAWG